MEEGGEGQTAEGWAPYGELIWLPDPEVWWSLHGPDVMSHQKGMFLSQWWETLSLLGFLSVLLSLTPSEHLGGGFGAR